MSLIPTITESKSLTHQVSISRSLGALVQVTGNFNTLSMWQSIQPAIFMLPILQITASKSLIRPAYTNLSLEAQAPVTDSSIPEM
jgi:hypothetical protein